MPLATQIATPFVVVEDLSVLGGPHRLVLVRERLMSTFDVDDTESPNGECNARSAIDTAVVRPSVHNRVGHPLEHTCSKNAPRRASNLYRAADSTHGMIVSGVLT